MLDNFLTCPSTPSIKFMLKAFYDKNHGDNMAKWDKDLKTYAALALFTGAGQTG